MQNAITPHEVMECYNRVYDFLDIDDPDITEDHPLLNELYAAGEAILRFNQTGELDFTRPLRNIIIIGKAIENISDIQIVDPCEEERENSISEIYGKKLLKEENPWEHLYEIEVANDCYSVGLDTSLVDEGNQLGPDIFVNSGGTRIDIECKRRREHNRGRKDKYYDEIKEKVDESINIGEDSYFVELTANSPLEKEALDEIAEVTVNVIEEQLDRESITINGVNYEIILHDYFSGLKSIDISKQSFERWFNNNIISEYIVAEMLSPFNYHDFSPGMKSNYMIKFTEEGETISKNWSVMDFNFPTIDEDLFNKIVDGTVDKGIRDLSGRPPAVLFVYLPAYDLEDMGDFEVEAIEEMIPQSKRLEQRIRGKLGEHSESTNAVVLNTTYFATKNNECQIKRGYKIIDNPSADHELPDKFLNFLYGESS